LTAFATHSQQQRLAHDGRAEREIDDLTARLGARLDPGGHQLGAGAQPLSHDLDRDERGLGRDLVDSRCHLGAVTVLVGIIGREQRVARGAELDGPTLDLDTFEPRIRRIDA
jgi:hypothetical protein